MRKLQANILTGIIILCCAAPLTALAQSVSSNYRLDEQFTGSGGTVDSQSTNYGGRDAIGDTAVGESDNQTADDTHRLRSGYVTDSDPRLAFIVDTTTVGFGELSTTATATATSTFKVLNYTSHGYIVQTSGNPPSSGSHVLAGMSSTDSSQTGTEQFGINLRANTSPTTFGADAQHVPDSSFSVGGAAGGYSTVNNFRYISGETIASAAQSSGRTDYTVSYIVNVSAITPGGRYSGAQELICVGTY